MFDNRAFNVNGISKKDLIQTIQLAFSINNEATAVSWKFDPKYGLILNYISSNDDNKFPVRVGAIAAAEMAFEWLASEDAVNMECTEWDGDADHDGYNERGWRVYLEDWGHVGGDRFVLCAIRPIYVWYGE